MKSHELLRQVFKQQGFKAVAHGLGLALSCLYKWCEPDGGKASGALNSLERLASLMRLTGDLRPLHWLCEQCGGYFVRNPKPKQPLPVELLPAAGGVMQVLGNVQTAVAVTVKENRVSPAEAAALRRLWEELKSDTEGFLAGCEQGNFRVSDGETTPEGGRSGGAGTGFLPSLLLGFQLWWLDTGMDAVITFST